MKPRLTQHFMDRVSERLPGVRPSALAKGAAWAINNMRSDVLAYSGRVVYSGKVTRAFSFETLCGMPHTLIVSDDRPGSLTMVTVYADNQD